MFLPRSLSSCCDRFEREPDVKPTPRQWLALLLLGVFVYVIANLAPYFIANLRLGRYVEELTQSSDLRSRPPGAAIGGADEAS